MVTAISFQKGAPPQGCALEVQCLSTSVGTVLPKARHFQSVGRRKQAILLQRSPLCWGYVLWPALRLVRHSKRPYDAPCSPSLRPFPRSRTLPRQARFPLGPSQCQARRACSSKGQGVPYITCPLGICCTPSLALCENAPFQKRQYLFPQRLCERRGKLRASLQTMAYGTEERIER